MRQIETHLSNRTMSSFPVSIGTGIMLESVFKPTSKRYDDTREIPNKVKIDDYGFHVYNMYTLIRNILSACTHPDKNELIADEYFIDVLKDELYVLETLYSETKCKPVFFIPDYTNVCKQLNGDKKQSNMKEYNLYGTLLARLKKIAFSDNLNIIRNGYKLPSTDKPTILTTSYPVDLLNKIPKLTLLESHTGKLKQKFEWNSKYSKLSNPYLKQLPFMEVLLYVFGDSNIIFPEKISVRTKVLEIAEKCTWTTRTTYDKVLHDIKNHDNENVVYEKILTLQKSY